MRLAEETRTEHESSHCAHSQHALRSKPAHYIIMDATPTYVFHTHLVNQCDKKTCLLSMCAVYACICLCICVR